MGCTVAELEQRVSASELIEWRIYDQIEPFGDHRADYHAAEIAYMIANAFRDPKGRELKFDDFIIRFGESDARSELETNFADVYHQLASNVGGAP